MIPYSSVDLLLAIRDLLRVRHTAKHGANRLRLHVHAHLGPLAWRVLLLLV